MNKKVVMILLFLISQIAIAQSPQLDVIEKINYSLKKLNTFPEEVNDYGWDDKSSVKRHHDILQKTSRYISEAEEIIYELLDDIERLEKKNFSCLTTQQNTQKQSVMSDLKQIKRTMSFTLNVLKNLEMSEISARVYTIYKNPNNDRYKRVAIPEIEDYYHDIFKTLKNEYNRLVKVYKTNQFLKLNTNNSIQKLTNLCQ